MFNIPFMEVAIYILEKDLYIIFDAKYRED